jgi:hypothetical protein
MTGEFGTGDSGLPPRAAEFAESMTLLRASHEFFLAILEAVRESTGSGPRGDPDLPGLFRKMNEALTDFAPHDHLIKQLLSRREP